MFIWLSVFIFFRTSRRLKFTIFKTKKLFVLVTVDWKAKPSSLSTTIDENVQSQFLKYYDYTFTDETGYWNLAASLSSTTMEEMKVEASKVVKHMDSFKEVTKSPRNILMKFDFNIRYAVLHMSFFGSLLLLKSTELVYSVYIS